MNMKTQLTTKEYRYQAPCAEIYGIEPEGVLCDSDFDTSIDTGASWKDETDASLPW